MNRIHRIVFNRATGLPQVASECASARGKASAIRRRVRRVLASVSLAASLLLPLGWMNSALAADLQVGTDGGDAFINPGSPGATGSQNISSDTTVDFVFVAGSGGLGGTLSNDGGAGGAGTLNIQGGAAQMSDVFVGGNGGDGGGMFSNGGAGGAGTLNIQGGTVQTGAVSVGGDGGDGNAGLVGAGGAAGAGTLNIQGGTVQMGAVSLGGSAGVDESHLHPAARAGAGGAGTANLSGGSISVVGNFTINANGTANFGWDGSASTAGLVITQSPAALINNGALNFRQTDSLTLASDISGTGSLTQNGAGTTILTGNSNTFGGTTLVNAGRLAVNGSIASSAVTVNAGGTLSGSGTVGATTIAAGGRLAPGNSIGTLTVTGNLTLNATSVYEVEVDPAGTASDLTHVTGTATLVGTVKHIGENGTYKPFSRYTILTADGGLIGTFDAVSSDYAFLDPSLEYDANNVHLALLRNNTAFAGVAQTANQRATAGGIESLASGNALYDAVVLLDEGAARRTFDQLSGEVHPSSIAALQSTATLAGRLPFNHLHANLNAPLGAGAPLAQAGDVPVPASALPQPQILPLWVEVVGNWQRLESDGNAASVDQDTGGLFVGGDHRLDNGWHLGAAFGYTDGRIRIDDHDAKADADSYSVSLYGGKTFAQRDGTFTLMFGGAYTWHGVDSERDVSVGGANQHLTADYDAHTTQFFTELSYAFPVTAKSTLEPFAGIAWSQTRAESFDEKGGSAALSAGSNTNDLTTTTLGVRGRHQLKLGVREANLGATLGWRHAEGDVRARSSFAFDGGQRFTVAGVPVARDAALVEAGAQVMLTRNAALGLDYTGQFGEGNRDHSGRVSLRWRF